MQFSEATKLTYDANIGLYTGLLGEYCFTAKAAAGTCVLTLYACPTRPIEELQALLLSVKSANVQYENEKLTITLAGDALTALSLAAASERLVHLACAAGMASACALCGTVQSAEESVRLYPINGQYTPLCMHHREQQSREKARTKNDAPVRNKDFAGAFGGAVLAFFVYIVAYQLGNVAPLLGGMYGFCVVMGYQKAGGAFHKKAALFSASICLVGIAISELVAIWVMLCLTYFWQGVSPVQSLFMLPAFLAQTDALRAAINDIAYAYLPMLLVHLWWYLRCKKHNRAK